MQANNWTLRELYRTLEQPGENPLRTVTAQLDEAVRAAYGVGPEAEPLAFLLELNEQCAALEAERKPIVGPGIPPGIPSDLVKLTDDRIVP